MKNILSKINMFNIFNTNYILEKKFHKVFSISQFILAILIYVSSVSFSIYYVSSNISSLLVYLSNLNIVERVLMISLLIILRTIFMFAILFCAAIIIFLYLDHFYKKSYMNKTESNEFSKECFVFLFIVFLTCILYVLPVFLLVHKF